MDDGDPFGSQQIPWNQSAPPPLPTGPQGTGPAPDSKVRKLISGMRSLNMAVGLYLLIIVASLLLGMLGLLDGASGIAISIVSVLAVLAVIGMAIYRTIAIVNALASSAVGGILGSVVAVVVLFIPLIGLLLMAMLSSRAGARLKEAGFEIGLLGAKT